MGERCIGKLIKTIILLLVVVMILSAFSINGFAAQTDGYTRDVTVNGITVTVGNKTINNAYSDPVDYWEIVSGNSLSDIKIIYNETKSTDSIIYTAFYPDTTTGRIGNYTEYVCELKNNRYCVTKINSSGDGTTYIPVGGFVLSLNNTVYPSFAEIGDSVTLGGGKLSIPTKAVESTKGKRVVIDAMNVKRSMPMVVYYDYGYGEKTGTNIYGTEMTVQYDFNKNSFIVTGFRDFLTGDASGSEIPDNGFVLSAYGSGYRQLLIQNHLFSVGDEIKTVGFNFVSINESMLESDYNNLANKVNAAVSDAEKKLAQLYDIDIELIEGYILQARNELDKLKNIKDRILNNEQSDLSDEERSALLMEYTNGQIVIDDLCCKIVMSLAESKVVSARSAWHRPCEKTYDEIKANVEMFKRIGINLIFVETFYHGCSAFKTDVKDIPYHPSLASGYTDTQNNIVYDDYLSAFVACCIEYGIEVHAWVENFYVGIDANANILLKHPDWIMYNDDGTYLQRKEGGAYIFIDPANVEVQDMLISYYNDLFEKHPDVAGLNLDYIRYPVSDRNQDTGYTMAAMKGFYDYLGKEFTEAQLADRKKMANKFSQLFDKNYLLGGQAEADANYDLWVKYRTQIITDYVCRIKNEVKEPNKIILSTAVFASLSESLTTKKQDWQSWFAEGWIEIATPMAYYTSSSVVQSKVEDMISLGGNNCLYYTGIASSYSGLPAWQNKEFIEASYNAGACGYVIFSSAQIVGHGDVQEALDIGVNRKWAVLPHADIDKILSVSFADILDKADRLYIPAGGMSKENREELEKIFDDIAKMPNDTQSDIEAIYQRLRDLTQNEIKNYANGYSAQRIIEQLDYMSSILDSRRSMHILEDEDQNSDDVNPPEDNNDSDNADNKEESDNEEVEEPKELGFFERLIQAIIDFFKKLFGLA